MKMIVKFCAYSIVFLSRFCRVKNSKSTATKKGDKPAAVYSFAAYPQLLSPIYFMELSVDSSGALFYENQEQPVQDNI